MSTLTVPLTEVFAKSMQQILEERIKQCCEKARVDAINQIQQEISEIVASTVLQIFEVCSFDRAGRELRITIDTSKMLKPKGEG